MRHYREAMKRVAVALIVALVGIGGLLGVAPAGAQANVESDFINRINAERTSRGLGALAVDGELTGIARGWSSHMASSNTLSHNPNFSKQVKQNWTKLGENVGVGDDAGQIHDAFMNSPAHKANILDSAFTKIGVGVVTGDDGRIWVTENFMRLQSDDNGGGAPPPTTAATEPPTSAAPSSSPPTTPKPPSTPKPTTSARPRPPTTPLPATTAPPATSTPSDVTTTTEPPPVPGQPAEAPYRVKLVLNGLQVLDRH